MFKAFEIENLTTEEIAGVDLYTARDYAEAELEEYLERAVYPRFGYTTAQVFETEDEYREFLENVLDEEYLEFVSSVEDARAEIEVAAAARRVVWLSQHTPTVDQRAYWETRGFEVVTPPTAPKFASGLDAWIQATDLAGGRPAFVVGVIPLTMVSEYLREAGDTPLLRADMEAVKRGGDDAPSTYEWRETWTRVVRVEIVFEPFTIPMPMPEMPQGVSEREARLIRAALDKAHEEYPSHSLRVVDDGAVWRAGTWDAALSTFSYRTLVVKDQYMQHDVCMYCGHDNGPAGEGRQGFDCGYCGSN